MENFDDEFGAPPADVDPAAEFLAQEQVKWIQVEFSVV